MMSAVARPIPLAAAVTTATLPSNRIGRLPQEGYPIQRRLSLVNEKVVGTAT
jgi:hypothetical protein